VRVLHNFERDRPLSISRYSLTSECSCDKIYYHKKISWRDVIFNKYNIFQRIRFKINTAIRAKHERKQDINSLHVTLFSADRNCEQHSIRKIVKNQSNKRWLNILGCASLRSAKNSLRQHIQRRTAGYPTMRMPRESKFSKNIQSLRRGSV
jgi:hypothetical protein